MAAHRRHKVGIVDLFSLDRSRFQKVKQNSGNGGILIGST